MGNKISQKTGIEGIMKKKRKEYDFKVLESKIDTLIKLIASGITYGKELKDQTRLLYNAGFKPKEIAKLLNKSANSVRVTLTLYKKK
ncbi:hypothetical protein ES705_01819 [subsurface metagenome]